MNEQMHKQTSKWRRKEKLFLTVKRYLICAKRETSYTIDGNVWCGPYGSSLKKTKNRITI